MEIVKQFLSAVLSLLPHSPFQAFIKAIGEIPFLAELNWFIPISAFIGIGEVWLTAIALFYVYSIILRWIRAID